jgi:hypothetical protein
MIGPGWIPRYRPRGLTPLKRTLAYTRGRRRASTRRGAQVRTAGAASTDLVLFDPVGQSESGLLHLGHGPAEFPVAALRPREARARAIALVAALQRWLVARWQWFKPRTVPCAVASLGMIAVMVSADYLAHFKTDAHHVARPAHIELAPR